MYILTNQLLTIAIGMHCYLILIRAAIPPPTVTTGVRCAQFVILDNMSVWMSHSAYVHVCMCSVLNISSPIFAAGSNHCHLLHFSRSANVLRRERH